MAEELLAAATQAVAFLGGDGRRLALSRPPRCDAENAENCTAASRDVAAAVAAGIVPALAAAARKPDEADTVAAEAPLREYCGLGVWMPAGACAAKRRPTETQLERRLDDPAFVFATRAIPRRAPAGKTPEQVKDARRASYAADVYGLGATLYAAVVGRLPFDGKSPAQVMQQVLSGDARRPSAYVELPSAVEEMIMWIRAYGSLL